MIHWDDRGPQSWNGVHVTHRTTVAELIDVDNVGPQGTLLAGFDLGWQEGRNQRRNGIFSTSTVGPTSILVPVSADFPTICAAPDTAPS